MKYLTITIAAVGICLLACTSEVNNKPTLAKEDFNTVRIKTVPVLSIHESTQVAVLGIVVSKSEAKPSFKTGGVINRTFVKEGDFVKKGQILATLMMDEINAQVRQAEEGLIKAERDMNRVKNLFADSVATLEQAQNSTSAFEVAKRTSEIARFNRSYSEVRAPIAGKVVKQIMHSGEIVGPGTPVYAIMGVDNQDWVINAGLIDRDWARVKIGDLVDIKMDAYPGKNYSGKVTNKTSIGGNASGTFDIDIKFKSYPTNLATGLTAKVEIYPMEKEYYQVIPIEALVKSNGKQGYLFTIKDGKAKRIGVQIVKLLGDKVAISSGLEDIKEVVTIGAMYLEEGDTTIIK
ncbi:MAG: efflux RND transporter periplasmic adaptor subunit [Saprospiraceae bacterium]|nr:efflux RND transporter periplasmic adaptor subunit [Saprospiraceae bacterium]